MASMGKEYPIIKSIGLYDNYTGNYNASKPIFYNCPLQMPKQDTIYPIEECFKYDVKHGTRLAFRCDWEYNDKSLRQINSNDPELSDLLSTYFWRCLHTQIFNRYIGINTVKDVKELRVCLISID